MNDATRIKARLTRIEHHLPDLLLKAYPDGGIPTYGDPLSTDCATPTLEDQLESLEAQVKALVTIAEATKKLALGVTELSVQIVKLTARIDKLESS